MSDDHHANGINAAGVVVGSSDVTGSPADGNGPYVAVTWDAAGHIHAVPTFGGAYGSGFGINAAGTITGFDDNANDLIAHAYLYTAAGTLADLGGLSATYDNTVGYAVNDLNQVVGYGAPDDHSEEHAFLYTDGQMYDLNDLVVTPGWTLEYANGINDDGQIVSEGIDPNGYDHAFLLTATGVVVPEPASLSAAAATALAAAGLLCRRRRRAVSR